jgi:pre-mRNA-splicing factor RBM22/SLT11
MTCARLKNCCQHCLLDLQFGLPVQVRDAALKLVAQGPDSNINREYFAQNVQGKFDKDDTPVDFGATDSAARSLLKRLAKSEPYYKRDRAYPCRDFAKGFCPRGDDCEYSHNLEDFTQEMRENAEDWLQQQYKRPRPREEAMFGGSVSNSRGGDIVPVATGTIDLTPPEDKNVLSLFLTGVEDDLPEYKIKEFFEKLAKVRSVVCVHKARSAFVNFSSRADAEKAAKKCNAGDIVIGSTPLRVQWGKPRPLAPIAEDQAKAVVMGKKAMIDSARAENKQARAIAGRAAYAALEDEEQGE